MLPVSRERKPMKQRRHRRYYFPRFAAGILSFSLSLQAADLLDAPGPGYRSQVEQLRSSNGPTRIHLTPAQLNLLRERLGIPLRSMSVPNPQTKRSILLDPLLPSGTLPELPRINPFDKPIRLFERATP